MAVTAGVGRLVGGIGLLGATPDSQAFEPPNLAIGVVPRACFSPTD